MSRHASSTPVSPDSSADDVAVGSVGVVADAVVGSVVGVVMLPIPDVSAPLSSMSPVSPALGSIVAVDGFVAETEVAHGAVVPRPSPSLPHPDATASTHSTHFPTVTLQRYQCNCGTLVVSPPRNAFVQVAKRVVPAANRSWASRVAGALVRYDAVVSGGAPSDDVTVPGQTAAYGSRESDTSFGALLRGVAAAPAVPVGSPAPLPAGTIVARKYAVESQLGAGGMGVVYLARDVQLNRRVAIKLHTIGADATERLLAEARSMAQLSHRNVVAVHEVGTYEDRLFIAMEFVPGGSLRTWVADRKPSWRALVRVFIDAAKGLTAAHDVGLVHRDFKPDNVLLELDPNGRVRRTCVADFGLAKPMTSAIPTPSDAPVQQLTATGAVMGTPAYMAPEQIEGKVVGPAADQFAFCVALYEALYGVRPFPGRTLPEIFTRIQSADIRQGLPGRKVPDRIGKLARRGLVYRPEARYPSMRALASELESALTRGRTIGLALGGLASAIAVASVTAVVVAGTPCDDVEEDLRDVWSGDRDEELGRLFHAADAAKAWDAARPKIDAYADAWREARRDACETALAGDEVSPAKLACLEQRKEALAAALAVLSDGSPATVRSAADVIAGLPAIEACAGDDALRLAPPPVPDADKAEVERVRKSIAEAEALRRAGKYEAAHSSAEAAVEAAEALAFVPVRAEARHVLGQVTADLGRYEEAQTHLLGAVSAAQASGHEEVLGPAASRLGYVVGVRLGRLDEADEWLRRAEASVTRRGSPPAELADVVGLRGTLLLSKGELVPARTEFERAIAIRREAKLADDDRTASFLTNLGAALLGSGLPDKAREKLAEAYDIRKRTLGAGHPRLVATAVNLARAMTLTHSDEDAIALLQGVLDDGGLAKDDPKMVDLLLVLGLAKSSAVMFGDPKKDLDAAVELADKVLPKDSPKLFEVHSSVGIYYSDWGKYQQARHHFAKALAAAEKAHGRDSKIVAKALRQLAGAEFLLGMTDESEAHEARATKIDGGGSEPTLELQLTPSEFNELMEKNGGVLKAPSKED